MGGRQGPGRLRTGRGVKPQRALLKSGLMLGE